MVREAGEGKVAVVNSINPYRLEGQKTIAFEAIEQLGKVPDVFALPVGNAGNISAAWKGFKEYAERRALHYQRCLVYKRTERHRLFMTVYLKTLKRSQRQSESVILQVGNLAEKCTCGIEWSNFAVTDEEILEAYSLIASTEGIFAEPGSCATIAGVKKQLEQGCSKKVQR